MSRIGKLPINVPTGVNIEIGDKNNVKVKGPKGELVQQLPADIIITRDGNTLTVSRPTESGTHRALHGLTRSLLNNMVTGVTSGFRRDLTIEGVGYRAAKDGNALVLALGYSHLVRLEPPEGITYSVDGPTKVSVSGIDKQIVGEEASKIRKVRPPEPYKGKGVRFNDEKIRRKAGKAGKAGGKGKK